MNMPRIVVICAAGVVGYAYFIGGTSISAGNLSTAKITIPAADVALIEKAATTCSILSAPLLAAQFYQESGFDPNSVSGTGAEGIAQFEPYTWKTWASPNDGDGKENPFNPADAIPAAARFDCALARQLSKVSGDQVGNMLAGYNAGAKAVLDDGGIPNNGQSPNYVSSIKALEARFTAPGTTKTTTVPATDFSTRIANGLNVLMGDL